VHSIDINSASGLLTNTTGTRSFTVPLPNLLQLREQAGVYQHRLEERCFVGREGLPSPSFPILPRMFSSQARGNLSSRLPMHLYYLQIMDPTSDGRASVQSVNASSINCSSFTSYIETLNSKLDLWLVNKSTGSGQQLSRDPAAAC